MSYSCISQQIEVEEIPELKDYILINQTFIDSIKNKIVESQKKALHKEKVVFIKTEMEDINYLKTLENAIETPYANYNNTFFENDLKIIFNKLKNSKVKSIYFLNFQTSGETINTYNFILVEGCNYQVHSFSFGNYKSIAQYKENNDILIDFMHEFMLNVPYSFKNKTLFNNGVQYFTIDKIIAIGKNKYAIESVVVLNMLNYQIEIFKKFFDVGN